MSAPRVGPAAVALALASVCLVDADLRGPLAAPAQVWLAGHPAEAARRFDALSARERAGLRLPGSPTPPDAPPSRDALERILADALHDDEARHLYRAVWLFDRGDRDAAVAELEHLARRRATDGVTERLERWSAR